MTSSIDIIKLKVPIFLQILYLQMIRVYLDSKMSVEYNSNLLSTALNSCSITC